MNVADATKEVARLLVDVVETENTNINHRMTSTLARDIPQKRVDPGRRVWARRWAGGGGCHTVQTPQMAGRWLRCARRRL